MKKILLFFVLLMVFAVNGFAAEITDIEESIGDITLAIDTIWIMIAGFLVFFMHAGFSLVEIGFTRSKNTINILMKNMVTVALGVICFFLVGFGIAYGDSLAGFMGTSGFALAGFGDFDFGIYLPGAWFFQAVFAATAATIISGAVAERIKFSAYLIIAIITTSLTYPVVTHWVWGGGWLSNLGFHDLAGSTVVHSVGGWSALAIVYVLGARLGKYGSKGEVNVIPGHNIPLGALGVLILWFGWFGFNPGSTLSGMAHMDIAIIATNTLLAAAAGTLTSMIYSWVKFGKPDITFTLNGALAGLVAITAGADVMSMTGSIITGSIAGVLLVMAVQFFDRVVKLDDPVGALSVHGVCGAFGTLAVGLFAVDGGLAYGSGAALMTAQAIGVLATFIWSAGIGLIVALAIKATIGIRVSEIEEINGLDIEEHAMTAYSEFYIDLPQMETINGRA